MGGRLQDKVALVTGAASGIGQATAELFAREGAIIFAADKAEPADPLSGAAFIHMDVSQQESWADAVERILERHGRIDVLVNNAGIVGSGAPVHEETLESWHQALAVNLTGVMLGMRAVVPPMIAQGSGSIINTSSIWGITAVPAGASYHASKGGVRTLSKHGAIAYAPHGIRVNSVHPGIVETPMTAGQTATNEPTIAATPLRRMARPIELAWGFVFLASDESSFMTGAELVMDGGYTAQ